MRMTHKAGVVKHFPVCEAVQIMVYCDTDKPRQRLSTSLVAMYRNIRNDWLRWRGYPLQSSNWKFAPGNQLALIMLISDSSAMATLMSICSHACDAQISVDHDTWFLACSSIYAPYFNCDTWRSMNKPCCLQLHNVITSAYAVEIGGLGFGLQVKGHQVSWNMWSWTLYVSRLIHQELNRGDLGVLCTSRDARHIYMYAYDVRIIAVAGLFLPTWVTACRPAQLISWSTDPGIHSSELRQADDLKRLSADSVSTIVLSKQSLVATKEYSLQLSSLCGATIVECG